MSVQQSKGGLGLSVMLDTKLFIVSFELAEQSRCT